VKHQESAAARAHQLSAERSVLEAEVVPLIDLRAAHATGTALLVRPVLVEQSAEGRGLAAHQRLTALLAEFLHVVQVLEHFGVVTLAASLLIFENLAGAA